MGYQCGHHASNRIESNFSIHLRITCAQEIKGYHTQDLHHLHDASADSINSIIRRIHAYRPGSMERCQTITVSHWLTTKLTNRNLRHMLCRPIDCIAHVCFLVNNNTYNSICFILFSLLSAFGCCVFAVYFIFFCPCVIVINFIFLNFDLDFCSPLQTTQNKHFASFLRFCPIAALDRPPFL